MSNLQLLSMAPVAQVHIFHSMKNLKYLRMTKMDNKPLAKARENKNTAMWKERLSNMNAEANASCTQTAFKLQISQQRVPSAQNERCML